MRRTKINSFRQTKILKEKQRETILHGALQLGPRILSFAALVLFQQGQLISQHGRLLLSMLQSRPQLHAVAFRYYLFENVLQFVNMKCAVYQVLN